MSDSRLSMNMGDLRASSVLSEVRAITKAIASDTENALRNSKTMLAGLAGMVGGFKSGGKSTAASGSNQTMNQPLPSAGDGGGGDQPPTMNQPTPGGPNKGGASTASRIIDASVMGGALFMQALPTTKQEITQNILATRMGFYGLGSGNKDQRYDQQQALAKQMFSTGYGINPLDASRAMYEGMTRGIMPGLGNYNQLATGVATGANLVPGLGFEGSMQGFAATQRPQNVNMMRFLGIQARDPITGRPRPLPQVIDQVWTKVNREKRGSDPLSEDDLSIMLLPGNSVDQLLQQITGGDQVLFEQIKAGLMAKVKGAKNFSRGEMRRVGLMTEYEDTQARRTEESFSTIAQTSRASAAGASDANMFATAVSSFANAVDRFTGFMKAGSYFKGLGDVFGGMGNFAGAVIGGGIVKGGINWLKGLFKADGGPVAGQNAYITGEEGKELFIPNDPANMKEMRMLGEDGPELFVPKVAGEIIPNHKLKFKGYRKTGGEVTPSDFAVKLIQGLGGTPTRGAIDAIVTWMKFEGGHWRNTADYNPLNTTLDKPGSHSMNSVGVEAYTSWDQGLEATIQTLTGSKAKQRGYTAIVNALKSGDREDILKAINNSAWRTGKTGGAGAYKGMMSSSAGSYADTTSRTKGGYSGGGFSDSLEGKGSGKMTLQQILEQQSPGTLAMMQAGQGGQGGINNATTNNNYGGVTIIVPDAKDPKKTAEAIKKILEDGNLTTKVTTE